MSIFGIPASSRRQTPAAPTSVTATDIGTARAYNNGAATVSFTPSSLGFEATSYTVTSSPGGFTATGASSPLTVTGLQSNTAYTFTVTATNFVGTSSASSASNSITATTVPQAPTIGTPYFDSGQPYTGSVNVWVPFTANATGGKAITSYTAVSGGSTEWVAIISPIGTSEIAGNARTFTVKATNANGESALSSTSSSITPASVPEKPTITGVTNVSGRPANSLQASVAFTAGATGGSTITSYTVTSSTGATNTGSSSPILVTETAPGTYSYTMTATNAQGTSSASTSSSASLGTSPTAPASLSAVVASSTSVTLTYGSFSNNGLAISALTGSGTSTGDITSTPAINLTYSGTPSTSGGTITVTGTFAAATSYTFSLRVRNSDGASSYTSTSTGITPVPTITDNFNRTTSGSLGTTSSGVAWSAIRGTWSANGSQGTSADAASNNSLASVAYGNANAVVSASVSSGTGVAFWVTDSGSWWAATSYNNQTSYTATANSGTLTYPAATCTVTSTTYSANPTTRTSSTSYSCPSGYTYLGYGSYGGYPAYWCSISSTTATSIKTCTETYGGGNVNSLQPCTGCYATVNGTYQFIGCCEDGLSGWFVGCKGLNYTTTTSYTTATGTSTYDACGGSKQPCAGNAGQCCDPVYTYNCVCNSGGSPSCTNCSSASCTSSYTYYTCPSGGTLSGTSCYSQFYYLKVYSSVSGTVTNPVSNINLGSQPAAIKVTTSGNSWTAQAYSNTSLATTLGTAASGTNSGTKGTSHGIIKTTSDYNQGTTVDDFSASS